MELIRKTISAVYKMKHKEYDDENILKIIFTDGTKLYIEGGYNEAWTGKSQNEYPSDIWIDKELFLEEDYELVKEIKEV